jgi:serine/threonine protein kinase
MAEAPSAGGSPEADLAFGHYRVLRRADGSIWELGRGAMGVTYKAFDEQLRIDVALKVITPGKVDDTKAQTLFLREARAAARVRHPNVASVVFLSTIPGNFFYAMEFVAGESLADWLQRRGALPPLLAIGFATQIARGLGAIHEQHIVHRDLKPANLMIVAAGGERSRAGADSNPDAWQIKIIDFGLARGFGDTSLGTAVSAETIGFRGTARYASPEQCQEEGEIDGRSDLYSLGCILWEMLMAAPPFGARTHRELLNQHVAQATPLERTAHLPASLQAVLARLLVKDPANRFPDAGAVIKALERCRDRLVSGDDCVEETDHTTKPAEPADAPPPAPQSAAKRTSGNPSAGSMPGSARARRPAAIAMVGAALLIAGAAWYISRARPPASVPLPAPPAVSAAPSTVIAAPAVALRKAIAVLPFSNLSSEKDNEYFADGIHEDVLSNLSKIRDLRVISRASVMPYKTGNRNLKQIASDLNVATVLEGSVRRAGNRVRITTQLSDARSEEVLWSATYDRELKDVFEIQTDVSQNIAQALQAKLSPDEVTEIREVHKENVEAYDLYLRGLAEFRKGHKEDNDRAIELYKQAIGKDPTYALVHAALADAYTMKVATFEEPPGWLDAAIQAAEKAISLDPRSEEAYAALGGAYLQKGWVRRAIAAYEKALQINPHYADAALSLSMLYFVWSDHWDKAWLLLRRSVDTAPDSPSPCLWLGILYFGLGEFDEGERWMRRGMSKLHDPAKEQQIGILIAYARKDYRQTLALMHERLGEGGWARANAAQSLGELPWVAPPGYCAFMSALRLGDSKELRQAMDSVLRIADVDGYNYRGILGGNAFLLRREGREQEMRVTCEQLERLCQRAIDSGNEYFEPVVDLAIAQWMLGNREDCDRSIDLALKAGYFIGSVDQRDTSVEILLENPKFVVVMAEMNRKLELLRGRIREKEKLYP